MEFNFCFDYLVKNYSILKKLWEQLPSARLLVMMCKLTHNFNFKIILMPPVI